MKDVMIQKPRQVQITYLQITIYLHISIRNTSSEDTYENKLHEG
jgi:hypothetical protein